MDKAGLASAGQVFHQNGSNGQVARSPPSNASRSPGNAFNFGNGSVNTNGMNHSTSFKERLASAQQQSARPAPPQAGSDGTPHDSSSDGVAKEETNGAAHGDEQFSMDM
jgi:hypothetical protein